MGIDKQLFLFEDASRELAEVDEWLSNEPYELFSIARQWFSELRRCGDDVNEIIHDGYPVACVGKAAFGYVNVFKSHVNIGFFTGAFIEDPHSLLVGTGKRMRHVKLRPEVDIELDALSELISRAYVDVKGRLD